MGSSMIPPSLGRWVGDGGGQALGIPPPAYADQRVKEISVSASSCAMAARYLGAEPWSMFGSSSLPRMEKPSGVSRRRSCSPNGLANENDGIPGSPTNNDGMPGSRPTMTGYPGSRPTMTGYLVPDQQ